MPLGTGPHKSGHSVGEEDEGFFVVGGSWRWVALISLPLVARRVYGGCVWETKASTTMGHLISIKQCDRPEDQSCGGSSPLPGFSPKDDSSTRLTFQPPRQDKGHLGELGGGISGLSG